MRSGVGRGRRSSVVKEVDAAFVFSSRRRPAVFTSSSLVDLCVVAQPSLQ